MTKHKRGKTSAQKNAHEVYVAKKSAANVRKRSKTLKNKFYVNEDNFERKIHSLERAFGLFVTRVNVLFSKNGWRTLYLNETDWRKVNVINSSTANACKTLAALEVEFNTENRRLQNKLKNLEESFKLFKNHVVIVLTKLGADGLLLREVKAREFPVAKHSATDDRMTFKMLENDLVSENKKLMSKIDCFEKNLEFLVDWVTDSLSELGVDTSILGYEK